MSAPLVVNGARAVVRIAGPGGKAGQPIGIFSSFSYGLNYDVQSVFILGRFSPAELGYTAQEPVRCTASGWRVVGNGPHVAASMPNLSALLDHEYIQIDVLDRQTGRVIAIIRDVRPESYSTTIAVKALTEVTHTFVGLIVDDESTRNVEARNHTDLPPVI